MPGSRGNGASNREYEAVKAQNDTVAPRQASHG